MKAVWEVLAEVEVLEVTMAALILTAVEEAAKQLAAKAGVPVVVIMLGEVVVAVKLLEVAEVAEVLVAVVVVVTIWEEEIRTVAVEAEGHKLAEEVEEVVFVQQDGPV